MALSNYTELQAAIANEIDSAGGTEMVAAIPDFIKRCESKINRKLRLREMEQLAYTSYAPGTTSLEDRLLALPTGYVEMLMPLRAKPATSDDTAYEELRYVDPGKISLYYGAAGTKLAYTLRDQIEFSSPVGTTHTIMMHFIKGWTLASTATNWLLTNYPDAYLYGSLVEASVFILDDKRAAIWQALFDETMRDLQELSERGRDDAELDISELSSMSNRGSWNVITG